MNILAAEESGLNARGDAVLAWFHDLWTRWSSEFGWAGEAADFVAGGAGFLLILMILYGITFVSRGAWSVVQAICEVIVSGFDWMLDAPDHYARTRNKLDRRWRRRPVKSKLNDAPVSVAPPTRHARRPARRATVAQNAHHNPVGQTPDVPSGVMPPVTWPPKPATAMGRASLPKPQAVPTHDPAARRDELGKKYGPPREGRSATTAARDWFSDVSDMLQDNAAGQSGPDAIKPIEVNEDIDERTPGQAPAAARDAQFWRLASACVELFREHAAHGQIPHNASAPPTVLAINYQGYPRGTYEFGPVVAGKPGWSTAQTGSPAPMEAYVTDDAWEVVASCVTFEGSKAKLVAWRMSSEQTGASNVSVGLNGHEYGVTVEEAYRFLARFLQDLAHPRF